MSREIIKDGQRNRNEARGSKSTHDDVQRAIDGLKDIPDDELQEFLDDEDFNIVDTWEGDEEHPEDIEGHRNIRDSRRNSRDRNRRRRGGSSTRERSRRESRRREDSRRDPSKSSKDIERDKMRTKRDTDSKMLAEKEKAIKHLLDSDTVVPPGTEVEAIETERLLDRGQRRSRERRRSRSPIRRRSHEKIRYSPRRDRSPFVASPDRRRSVDKRRSSERRRRPSWERRNSTERRDRRGVSNERIRRRIEERDMRITFRRSRSRERHRSRTPDRKRRMSRSPVRRGSSRRRSYSKSPDRRRKRSPFINEIARQFRDEALLGTASINQFNQRPGLLPTPVHPVPPPSQHYLPMMDPGVPMMPGPGPFMSFEPPPPMNFEPVPMQYNAPPVMYDQGNPMPQAPFGLLPVPSPQPVPAPVILEPPVYNQKSGHHKRSPSPAPKHYDRARRSTSSQNGIKSRPERLKTPEPPVISNSKNFEKTSLSSLLEASVSAKDSGCAVLYPGFKPEILRNCEMALRSLPEEDPRLKMSGRFFFDPTMEEPKVIKREMTSNSLLIQRTKKLIWDDEELEKEKLVPRKDMFQKYTQTETFLEEKCTQTDNETLDFCVQVCPGDLQPSPPPMREEKRPIMDRLDWSVRDNYEFPSNRDASDLRWSLSNSRSWSRASPSLQERETRTRSPERERDSRVFDLSPVRSRDNYSHSSRNNFGSRERDRFSPTFRRSMEHQDDYGDNRSEHSRGDSPSVLDESDDIEIIEESFSRDSSWRGRGKSFGQSRNSRGRFSGGRSFRGRGGGFRGKF